MPSCECCWRSASVRAFNCGGSVTERYYAVQKEHEDIGCECTKDTLEGRKARAGQFWDEEKGLDPREGAW